MKKSSCNHVYMCLLSLNTLNITTMRKNTQLNNIQCRPKFHKHSSFHTYIVPDWKNNSIFEEHPLNVHYVSGHKYCTAFMVFLIVNGLAILKCKTWNLNYHLMIIIIRFFLETVTSALLRFNGTTGKHWKERCAHNSYVFWIRNLKCLRFLNLLI